MQEITDEQVLHAIKELKRFGEHYNNCQIDEHADTLIVRIWQLQSQVRELEKHALAK